jgi:hypothetical protein
MRILLIRRKALPERVTEARTYLHEGGLHENPDDVLYLLLTEIRTLNGRLAYLFGILSVVVALLLAHVVTPLI